MDRTKDVPEVTQADRNGAVRLLEAGGQDWQAKEIRLGQGDHFPIVKAFARHRTEAARPLTAEIADLRAQLDEAMEAVRLFPAAYDALSNAEMRDAKGNLRSLIDQQANALAGLRAILAKRKQP
jgi:hypothetical protein